MCTMREDTVAVGTSGGCVCVVNFQTGTIVANMKGTRDIGYIFSTHNRQMYKYVSGGNLGGQLPDDTV
jgi:hypothetical protein